MTKVPELEIIIIKLMNGETIITTMDKNMSYGDRNYILIDPVLIDKEKFYEEDDIIEFTTYKTWIPGTNQKLVNIPIQHVLTYVDASDDAINSYNEYNNGRKAQASERKLEHMTPNIPIQLGSTIH